MHTQIHILRHKHATAVRWLTALLLAWSLACAWASQAQAAACTPTQPPIELWAKTGTLTLPDSTSINIWGYSTTAGGAAQLPGPTLTVNQGACVAVTLHNNLAEPTSLALHGQGLAADRVGAAPGGTATYTFSAARPGTFLYEAGLTTNGARQVGMGLYGALVVKPATAPGTYSSETTLVLSEIDPDLNAAPTAFDMGEYKPRYWLINGQAYPNIPAPSVASGSSMRIRYVNAGLNENSMGLLGLTQQVIAADGYPAPSAYTVVAETIPPGGTLDTLVAIPGAATSGAQYALYSTAQHLDNAGAAYGGQLLYLTVGSSTPTDQPPTVSAGNDQTITLPAVANLDGTVTDDGVSPLTTVWSMSSGPGAVAFGNASLVDTTATFPVTGTYILRLTATDGTGPVFDEVSITVNSGALTDQPPTVNAGNDQTITLPAVANLDGTVTDDGVSPLTTAWNAISGPGSVTFGDVNQIDTTASFSAAGSYVLSLTATDATGSISDTASITVNSSAPNTPPSVNAGADQTISVTTASLVGVVTDDGLLGPVTLSWSLVSGPGVVTFTLPTASSTAVSFSALGTYTLRLTANDGQFSQSDDVVINVNAGKHIGDLDQTPLNGIAGNWIASVTITVHNAFHNPVAGATITGSWSGSGTGGGSCLFPTNASGQCTVVRAAIPAIQTTNTFTVTNVTGANAQGAYVAIYNHDPDTGAQASDGTTITVNHP